MGTWLGLGPWASAGKGLADASIQAGHLAPQALAPRAGAQTWEADLELEAWAKTSATSLAGDDQVPLAQAAASSSVAQPELMPGGGLLGFQFLAGGMIAKCKQPAATDPDTHANLQHITQSYWDVTSCDMSRSCLDMLCCACTHDASNNSTTTTSGRNCSA